MSVKRIFFHLLWVASFLYAGSVLVFNFLMMGANNHFSFGTRQESPPVQDVVSTLLGYRGLSFQIAKHLSPKCDGGRLDMKTWRVIEEKGIALNLLTEVYVLPESDRGKVIALIKDRLKVCPVDSKGGEFTVTPLQASVMSHEPELVALYLQAGADGQSKLDIPGKPRLSQMTPLDLARKPLPEQVTDEGKRAKAAWVVELLEADLQGKPALKEVTKRYFSQKLY